MESGQPRDLVVSFITKMGEQGQRMSQVDQLTSEFEQLTAELEELRTDGFEVAQGADTEHVAALDGANERTERYLAQ